MSRLRRGLGVAAIALSMQGCTLIGLGFGASVAHSKNGDPQVQQGQKPRTSVVKSMALGGVLGLLVDIGFVALSIHESGGPGH